MTRSTTIDTGFRLRIISHAVWPYHRFGLSFRDVEDLLAQRGIIVSSEAIRLWCGKFGLDYARKLRRRQGRLGDTWFLDEVFATIRGQRHYHRNAPDSDRHGVIPGSTSKIDSACYDPWLRQTQT